MTYIGATAPENKAGRQAGRQRCRKKTGIHTINVSKPSSVSQKKNQLNLDITPWEEVEK